MNFQLKGEFGKPLKYKISKKAKLLLTLLLIALTTTNVFSEKNFSTKQVNQAIKISNTLTLNQILSLVLAGNPKLNAFSWDLRASDAKILQAKLPPNPSFNFQIENFGGSGELRNTDAAEITYMLNQLVELGGKRSARTDVAKRIHDSKKSDYEIKRMEVFGNSMIDFFHVAADQQRLELAKIATKQALSTLDNIENRVKAGKSSSVEASKAKVLLAQFKVEEEHAEHELETAKLRLAATWGAREALFNKVEAKLFKRETIPSYKKLVSNLDKSPIAKRWLHEEEVRKAKVELEKSNRIPDVTLGVGYRRFEDSGSDSAVVQFSIPLPLFNRNQHQLSNARALLQKTQALKRNSRTKATKLIFSVYQELIHAETEMKESEKVILPAAKSALKAAKEGFKRGRFSYLELADTQKIFLETKHNYIRSALEYQEGVVELEKLTGISLRSKNSLINFKEK